MKKIYRIGVDLGGTNIATGLVDANDVVVDKLSCKTDLPSNALQQLCISSMCAPPFRIAVRAAEQRPRPAERVRAGTFRVERTR